MANASRPTTVSPNRVVEDINAADPMVQRR
jgi:hypothetical protein